jgi:protein SCO1/2
MTTEPRGSKPLISRGLTVSLMLLSLWGCSGSVQQQTQPPEAGPPKPSNRAQVPAETVQVKEYGLKGVVRKVEKEAREVMIRHEAIPGFMGAMTMPFRLEDQALLEDLRPGDEIEGKLRVEFENGQTRDYRLIGLTVTKPALAAPLVLDLSAGVPKVRPKPRRLEPGEEVPDFAMTGQDGRRFRLSDLRGNVVALTFIYTRCPLPDFCPMMDRKFADLARSIEAAPERARQVRLLSVSFDPDHDTPEVLRKHAQIRGGAPPLWTFAVASHEELSRIMGPLGLIYGPGKDEIVHNLCTAVIGPTGKLVRLEVGTKSNKWSSADLLKTIYSQVPSRQK